MKNVLNWEEFLNEEKKDPQAAIRNRGFVVFPAGSKYVNDDKDHFPINSKEQSINALARASQYDKVPDWYEGTLEELVMKVHNKVKKYYPEIEVTEKSEKPGKD